MLGAVGPGDGFIFARMIEADNRQHHSAFFVHHRAAPLFDARNHFGKSSGELRAAAHSRNLTLAGGIVRRDHAVLNALAVFVEGSVLAGACFHAFEVRIRYADQLRARGIGLSTRFCGSEKTPLVLRSASTSISLILRLS